MSDTTDTTEERGDADDNNPEAVYEALGLPGALIKALGDPFDYALGLRSGQIIRFESARLSSNGEWVHLTTSWDYRFPAETKPMQGVEYTFDRGIDVRIDEIAWIADAPRGS